MGFKKAKREKLKALIAMMGASGSGKTFSSLRMAKGMIQGMFPDLDTTSEEFWEKVGVIDTEHNRSKIYADVEKHGVYIGEFSHMNLEPPFTVDKYIKGIKEAKEAGIEVLIIDSTTHLWKDLLQEQSDLGGRYQDWGKVTPKYERFINEFVYADLHIIATMRSKQSYALEESGTGKLGVTKIGEKPIQRDDFEYEFLVGLMFDQRHFATVTKDNSPLFEPLGNFVVEEQHGIDLINWLDKGVDVKVEKEKERYELLTQIDELREQDSITADAVITDMEERLEQKAGKVIKIEHFNLKQVQYTLDQIKKAFSKQPVGEEG
jgi:hypothetical protein